MARLCYSPISHFIKLLMVTAIHDFVVFFADVATHGTAVVTASVMLMGLLKVVLLRPSRISNLRKTAIQMSSLRPR
jgi:hypothetical protein